MKYLILSLLLLSSCSTTPPKDHKKIGLDWVFRKVRNSGGSIIIQENGRPLKNACISREEFKKWKAYKIRHCKGR